MIAPQTTGLDAGILDLIERIDPQQIHAHVETITSYGPRCEATPAGVRQVLHYMKSTLAAWSYAVHEEACPHSDLQVNVFVESQGTSDPHTVIEIGAHYDTVGGSPGADDNASGVAGLLEIARVLRIARCARTIRLCFFALEEEGRRGGSYEHVARLRTRPEERHLGILVFEMIGFSRATPGSQRAPVRIPFLFSPPTTGDFICLVSNIASAGIASRFERAARHFVPDLRVYAVKRLGGLLRDAARSDHVPYWAARRSAIMITDTANFRNPHYHKPTDTADTLDYTFCTRVARATLATVLQWAGLDPTTRPSDGAPYGRVERTVR